MRTLPRGLKNIKQKVHLRAKPRMSSANTQQNHWDKAHHKLLSNFEKSLTFNQQSSGGLLLAATPAIESSRSLVAIIIHKVSMRHAL